MDVVDLSGATLLLGLVDNQIPLAFDASANPAEWLAAMSMNELRGRRWAAASLSYYPGAAATWVAVLGMVAESG